MAVSTSGAVRKKNGTFEGTGQGWIRTSEGVKPADLQSAPFGHSGTYPFASVDIGSRSTCCKSALRRGSLHSVLGEDGPPMPSSLLLTPAFKPVMRHPTMRRKPFQRLSCGLQNGIIGLKGRC